MTSTANKCWIFGDESGVIGNDRFFAIGIIGTENPRQVIAKLKEIRERAMVKILDTLYAHILEEPELNSLSCDKLEIVQIRSVCMTLSPC